MLILGLDSTAVSASVALAEVKDGVLSTYSLFTVKNKLTHSETLLPMIEQMLKVYGVSVDALELLAVNVGPGSFTGVRIGVSTVKGLAYPKGLPCAPVSTLASLAENVGGTGETVCALMDARRDQFYCALFCDGKRLSEDACLSGAEIRDLLAKQDAPAVLCGDGAALFHRLFGEGLSVRLAPPVSREQNALSVALSGYEVYRAGNTVTGKELRPVYLRLPQAERERLAKQTKEEPKT